MGAIVTIRVPAGTPLEGLREGIQRAITNATGEQVNVTVNAVSQLQRRKVESMGTSMEVPQNIQSMDDIHVPTSIPDSK